MPNDSLRHKVRVEPEVFYQPDQDAEFIRAAEHQAHLTVGAGLKGNHDAYGHHLSFVTTKHPSDI